MCLQINADRQRRFADYVSIVDLDNAFYRISHDKKIATIAPIIVLIKLTKSLVNQVKRDSRVAPIKLSMVVAIKAATTHQTTPIGLIKPIIQAIAAKNTEAKAPARVPSRLTAPSVPLGNWFQVSNQISGFAICFTYFTCRRIRQLGTETSDIT